MNDVITAGLIFLLTFVAIISEKVHRTVVALAGGLLLIILGVVDQAEAFESLDLNVIFLLVGMMVIAAILAETGVFQWMAVRAVQLGKGRPLRIMVILALVTAFSSTVLNNVTVVVLIAPVALFVASSLGISPVPFLLTSVMASNIGGAATLIGDPPNILIGSAADFGFLAFLINMGPPVVISLGLYMLLIRWQFKELLKVDQKQIDQVRGLKTSGLITQPRILVIALVLIIILLILFLLEDVLGLEAATIALGGATAMLILTGFDPTKALKEVEWSTLMFFVGLFIVVEAVVKVGLIETGGAALLELTQGNLRYTTHLMLWFSAIASGIVDNIPYTATMIPLLDSLSESMDVIPLWWALALGADFGGNLTLVGSSANIVAADLVEARGYRISFREFFKYGSVTVIMTLIISSIWLELAYLR